MLTPTLPENESQRQLAVERSNVVDTPAEYAYDEVTGLLAHLMSAPIALIAILDGDRNWLKSHHGVELQESPRDISFCGHTINADDSCMVVEDARIDHRFHDNPLVLDLGAIFYAGVSLTSHDGYRLGTLCIYDRKPRSLDAAAVAVMKSLASIVETMLSDRLKIKALSENTIKLAQQNVALSRFAQSVAHDMRSPLTGILLQTELLIEDEKISKSDSAVMDLDEIRNSIMALSRYVDGVFLRDSGDSVDFGWFDLSDIFDEVRELLIHDPSISLQYPIEPISLLIDKVSLLQILVNLVSNSITHNKQIDKTISVEFCELENYYQFTVTDNGNGVEPAQLAALLDLNAYRNSNETRVRGKNGSGLNTVLHLLVKHEGMISGTSTPNLGSCITFTMKKFHVN